VSTVSPASRDDLRATARLHRELLPDGFFARLGAGFLRSYHRTFVRSPHGVAFVAGDQGDPEGFLVGTVRNRLHYRFVVRCCGARLALRGAFALLVRPRLAWLFLRTRAARYVRWALRYPLRRTGAAAPAGDAPAGEASPPADRTSDRTPRADRLPRPDPSAPPTGPVAVLTHVAVDERAQGNGSGRALVDAFLVAAREAGVAEARLVTDAGGSAEQFYERLGWSGGQARPGSGNSLVREFRLSLHENAPS